MRVLPSLLWLLFAACCGFLGFYYGIREGAYNIGTLATMNQAHEAFATLRESIDVIDRNDLATANEQHRRNAVAALTTLGAVSTAVGYWECNERENKTLADAKRFLEPHPDPDHALQAQLLRQGLSFCALPARR